MSALSDLCVRRLGFDPLTLSPEEQVKRLPDIISAVVGQQAANKLLLEKTALRVSHALKEANGYCLNPGIVRDEKLQPVSESPAPGNEIFDSLFPPTED